MPLKQHKVHIRGSQLPCEHEKRVPHTHLIQQVFNEETQRVQLRETCIISGREVK